MIQQIYGEIQKQSGKHAVIELCAVYGGSRSGYYKRVSRGNAPNRYEQEQHKLDYLVADVHSHHPAMGYRQIRDYIQNEHGMKYCDISIWKSMKRLNIYGYTRKRKRSVQRGLAHIAMEIC